MQVIDVKEENAARWDRYVYTHPFSSFFQLFGWKRIMEKSFGCKTCYLVALEKDNIRGILPLYIVRSWISGNSVTSMPGGICNDNEEIEKLLYEKAKEITKKYNAKYLLLRDCSRKYDFDLKVVTYNTSILGLKNDKNELWKSFDGKARNQTRKAIKEGLKTTLGENNLKEFYKVFSINMRDLGTPVFPYKFFDGIVSEFPEETEILTVNYKDEVIGGMILFFFKDTISDPWASSLREYFPYCPNNLLYWEAFKYGCDNGFKYFDMGRSQKDSGTFKFKKQWGAEARDLYYQYFLHNCEDIPVTESDGFKYKLISKGWKKLPVGLANALGPVIRSKIPFG